jgi:ribosomal protein S18 acetylase RimI-like enzyme
MKNVTIRTFTASDRRSVAELQSAYTSVYPDAPVIPGELYLSPAFEGGHNVYCAVDECSNLLAYAPLYPVLIRDAAPLPHTLWVEIKTDPACETPAAIKDQLFEQLLLRAREVTAELPGHPVHLTFQYFPSETASIEYVLSRGCRYTESVFSMRRDLTSEVSTPAPPREITIRLWRMQSEAEQQMYVEARNECFPEAPIALGEWQYFMKSPQWSVGTTLAAFDGDQLVGNVALFWDEAQNQQSGRKIGFTEHIFVRPAWRGRNIARCLINGGLTYLKQQGLTQAHLEVRAENRNALGLYTDLGYEVFRESRFYMFELGEA